MKKVFSPQLTVITIMILVAAFSRLLTNYFHVWNFTPVCALALFSGAQIRDKRLAFLVPLIAMLVTDVFLGFYQGIAVVYAALAIITAFGLLLQNRIKVIPIVLASLGSSVIFFLVTNFALFYPTMLYPHSWKGIVDSYAAALLFYRQNNFSAVVGDLLYTGVLFGSYELFLKKIWVARKVV